MMTIHLHRPRSKNPRPPLPPTKVTGPYRAEHKKKKVLGAWRKNVEEALADAKLLGSGSAVVSSEGVLLAKFENAIKLSGREMRDDGFSKRAGRPPKQTASSEDEILEQDDE